MSVFNYSLFHLLVFPGLLFAIPAAWFFMWVERKSVALMQQRIGPPFMQPYYDFLKLMGKQSPILPGMGGMLMKAWPALAVMTMLASLGLLPVAPHGIGFAGDLILLATLLELPSIFSIIAGFTSKSLFAEVGSAREAVLGVANGILFLTALVHDRTLGSYLPPLRDRDRGSALRCGCWESSPSWPAFPPSLRLNPFSTANAEQEIYAGALTEYAGPDLAFWELAHGLEWMALTGLVACFAIPPSGNLVLDICSFVLTSFLLVLVFAAISAGTARLTLNYSVRLYCTWGLVLMVLGFSSALLMRIKL